MPKIKILDSDTVELKQAKQALLDLKDDAIEAAKEMFKSNKDKDFDIKSEEAQKVIDEKVQAGIKAAMTIKDGTADKLIVDFIKEIDESLAKLSAKVKTVETKEDHKVMSFDEAFTTEYKAQEDKIKAIVKSEGKQSEPLVFEIKAAVTMGDFNTIGGAGSASHYSLTTNTGIISAIRKRILTYLQYVSTGMIEKPYAMWIEELDEQGVPIFIGEGVSKTPLSVRYEEREAKAKKIAVFGKVTTEMMDDLPQLISYIQSNLAKRLDIKKEDQLFTGDGTGENLLGLSNYASAFTGGGLAGTIRFSNVFDVINAAILQVKKAFGEATGFWINETFLAQMISIKTSLGEYTSPNAAFLRVDDNGFVFFRGVRLIGTNALDGLGIDFIGGDTSVINVRNRMGLRVQIGLDGNDFTTNKKTILLEERLVQFVSANDTQQLVKGSFAAAEALLGTT
jgi:HK97 family phage major capsid protein